MRKLHVMIFCGIERNLRDAQEVRDEQMVKHSPISLRVLGAVASSAHPEPLPNRRGVVKEQQTVRFSRSSGPYAPS